MSRFVSFQTISSVRTPVLEKMEIKLTEVEEQLCTLLDECTKHLSEEKGINTSCRIAGGWLLGSDSNDMDIALTDMMGYAFALEFNEFASELKHIPVKAVSKVKGNPDQSKHLETAKTVILGIELDFVNLRDEEYAEGSRIPTKVTFGTPLQDALRRDTTINSLFYNVHTRLVEDHCEKGLDDLKNGIIRTPLPPKQTFLDDPLRVIRCVRFASRFGFGMVHELEECARDPEIQTALAQKITRERVGEEMDKMMSGHDPLRSLQLIESLSLFSTIFHISPSIASTLSSRPAVTSTSVAAATILQTFINPTRAAFKHPDLHPLLTLQLSAAVLARLHLACALTPYRAITYMDHKKKVRPAVEAAIREGLKIGTKNHYLDGIPALFAAANILKSPEVGSNKLTTPSERVAIGLMLRDPAVHNPLMDSHWTSSLLFALVQELVPLYDIKKDDFDVDAAAKCIQIYNDFVSRVEELGLDRTVDAKPILDGRAVLETVGAAKMGQWTGRALAKVIEWQLDHPDGTKEQCAEWLKSERAAGRLVVEDDKTGAGGKRGKGDVQETAAKKSKR
ncbi:hypothetical protein EW146_g3555 [Bondarzewia mesenterica]|uniref:Poly A polymerase head domain-containing protein n=1 Tax=Bondarzewia mesenterica TaxID=1095465 RepID=A0A4S4LXF2_9AGAM|nr:hypothetical protein EW146_g3555 [Bondarzewia mesenterica]